MARLTKKTLSNTDKLRGETVIDRSTRISRQILEDEAEQRELKTSRLRKARLEKEAERASGEPAPTARGKSKKP